jgi:hypothetical protein|tara:strand:- start:476 stop:688 length:213 start_codon:yes stop_codon:yes gene_type:complete
MSNILTKEDRERWFFLSKRIEYLNGCIASLNTGVRSSGAGQYDRERYGKEIDKHEAEMQHMRDKFVREWE